MISFKQWLSEKVKKKGSKKESDYVPSAPTIDSAPGSNGPQAGIGDVTRAGGGED